MFPFNHVRACLQNPSSKLTLWPTFEDSCGWPLICAYCIRWEDNDKAEKERTLDDAMRMLNVTAEESDEVSHDELGGGRAWNYVTLKGKGQKKKDLQDDTDNEAPAGKPSFIWGIISASHCTSIGPSPELCDPDAHLLTWSLSARRRRAVLRWPSLLRGREGGLPPRNGV